MCVNFFRGEALTSDLVCYDRRLCPRGQDFLPSFAMFAVRVFEHIYDAKALPRWPIVLALTTPIITLRPRNVHIRLKMQLELLTIRETLTDEKLDRHKLKRHYKACVTSCFVCRRRGLPAIDVEIVCLIAKEAPLLLYCKARTLFFIIAIGDKIKTCAHFIFSAMLRFMKSFFCEKG
jgi:hypothetical protein